jgi:hypothetical protein
MLIETLLILVIQFMAPKSYTLYVPWGSNHIIGSHTCPFTPLFYFLIIFYVFQKNIKNLKFFLNTIMLRCILKKPKLCHQKILLNCVFSVKIVFKLLLSNFLVMVTRGSLKVFWFKHLSLVPNLVLHIPRLPIVSFLKNQNENELGENMKKGANHAKDKVLSKDCYFHVAIFYCFILHFSHNFFNWISNLRPNMRYNMIKLFFFYIKPYIIVKSIILLWTMITNSKL